MREAVTIAAAWLLTGVAVFLIGAGPAKTAEWRGPDGLTVSMQLVAFAIMVGAWPYVAWRWFVRRA